MSLDRTRSVPLRRPIFPRVVSIFFWREAARTCGEVACEPSGRTSHSTAHMTTGRSAHASTERRRMRPRMVGAGGPAPCKSPCARERGPGGLQVALRRWTTLTAMKTSFGRDTGLQVRMLVTMLLVGLVYVVFAGVLFASVGGAVAALGCGLLLAFQFFASDKLALRSMGAREVSPQEAPEFHAMIERLCVQADIPKPKVAVVNSPLPNAFALGRSPKAATVCATTGIMDLLSPSELEGVMAHEITHIVNRDVMIMTLAGFFASIASMIVQFGFFFGGGYGGGNSDDDDGPSFMVIILVSAVVWVVSFFLMQALSRYREFAADRGAAVITGRPSALASALMKISGINERIPQGDLRAHAEMNAFYIVPVKVKESLYNIFSTPPPMDQRIAALSRLESQLQSSGPVRPALA